MAGSAELFFSRASFEDAVVVNIALMINFSSKCYLKVCSGKPENLQSLLMKLSLGKCAHLKWTKRLSPCNLWF